MFREVIAMVFSLYRYKYFPFYQRALSLITRITVLYSYKDRSSILKWIRFLHSNCFLNAGVPDADGEAHGEEELPREAPRGGRDARLHVHHLLR